MDCDSCAFFVEDPGCKVGLDKELAPGAWCEWHIRRDQQWLGNPGGGCGIYNYPWVPPKDEAAPGRSSMSGE